MKFSSRDRDNDFSNDNCAKFVGGFWYNSCGGVEVHSGPGDNSILVINGQWLGTTLVEMKIRPKDCIIDKL